jgi:hypothetical protein
MSKSDIKLVKRNLQYALEDLDTAKEAAKGIKDPELTKRLDDLHTQTTGTRDYLESRLDPKRG